MRRLVLVLAIAMTAAGGVRADPAVTLDWDDAAPALHVDPSLGLDPTLGTELEGIAAQTVDAAQARYALGARAYATIRTSSWTSDRDARAEGWTADARFVRDLGWNLSLVLDASIVRAAGGLERADGTYASFSIAVARLFRLGHGRVAWLSLGVSQSTWFGEAPSAVPGGTVVGFHAGMTF